MDCVDYNTMFHNALDNLKQKIRKTEATAGADDKQSYFARVANNSEAENRRQKNKTIDIRQYFTAVSERDNILALASVFSM